mmetsp:Transcript_486/g.1107  ORF Transcript_486/g.1107 Transcript_486/m.1107 type:complete len:240 (+) Transcript_486:147-866(+)|eukprot:CAMPEP_0181110810 /NCGR_PEP_ID=MMETSP1071-20121207/18922_1 /TAXON_ID=35127 /ORGANISM="Thalassiosira sp., Strain NH16" /LENGTH=239 /DNA_ID=CAMNT_0023194625 /DNA_START=65 /DNA_END=784 /DNA_ORIENTATION=+
MSRYARLLNNDHDQTDVSAAATANVDETPNKKMSNMFASLKESAASAGGSMRENMSKASDSVKSGLGLPTPQASDDNSDAGSDASSRMLDEVSELCPKLTYHQRIMGFGICFTCGYLMTFMSFRLFIKLVEGNPAPFVFLYTSGNVMSLMSSMFLSGPKRQCQSMFDEKRQMTSITYLVSLACSIAVCFIPIPTGPKIGLLVLLLLVQMAASLWYTLSYIPYGRATAKRMLRSFMSGDE